MVIAQHSALWHIMEASGNLIYAPQIPGSQSLHRWSRYVADRARLVLLISSLLDTISGCAHRNTWFLRSRWFRRHPCRRQRQC